MSKRHGALTRSMISVGAVACLVALVTGCSSSSESGTSATTTSTTEAAPLAVTWMDGFQAPGTPAQYNQVGVVKVGSSSATNVLVLEPGTSAGAAYFVPMAQWIVEQNPDWQVWAVERRENLLEDQSVMDAFKQGTASSTDLFNYYLGYLNDPSVTDHYQPVANDTVEFAKQWGMNVAVQDLKVVIDEAAKLGGKVVLGGHSLGGTVVTAYATWDFDGQPGASQLAGLVYIDGGSNTTAMSEADANADLAALEPADASPWLNFGGIPAPYAGVFSATGSASALRDPDTASLGQSSGLLPADIVPTEPVTNVGQYGYALNVGTSPDSLAAAQAHLGAGLSPEGPIHGWDGTGALTPIDRYATMFSGGDILSADGTEWFFPQRLTDDTGAVGNGIANPAQAVLDVHSTMGSNLPQSLLIYAFGASLGGARVPAAAQALAQQSGIPDSNLTLVDRSSTYAHNDPAGAYPTNDFVDGLLPFLQKVSSAS